MRVLPLLLALVVGGCSAGTSADGAPSAGAPSMAPSAVAASMAPSAGAPSAVPSAEGAPSAGRHAGAATSPHAMVTPSDAPQMDVRPEVPRWDIERIDAELHDVVVGRNWHPGCPVALHDLRLVTIRYRGFDGDVHAGPLIVHERVAEDVQWVFRRLLREDFPIQRVALARRWRPIRPRDWFDTHNITASFNCRPVTNGTSFSQHSYGWAVDVNPLQNPYVNEDGVLRRAAKAYVDRTQDVPGMIHPGDVVVRSFARIGWEWGGSWQSLKDYQHFSLTGR